MKLRAFLSALLLAVLATSAQAHDYQIGPIAIDHPWTRATPKNAPVAGGYLKITNTGTTADRLVGGSSEVAKRFQVITLQEPQGLEQAGPLRPGPAFVNGMATVCHRGRLLHARADPGDWRRVGHLR